MGLLRRLLASEGERAERERNAVIHLTSSQFIVDKQSRNSRARRGETGHEIELCLVIAPPAGRLGLRTHQLRAHPTLHYRVGAPIHK